MCRHTPTAKEIKSLPKNAQEELKIKMELERIYMPELARVFNQIAREYEAVLESTGVVLDASRYEIEFDALARKQATRTQKKFTNRLRDQLPQAKQDDEADPKAITALIASALLAWRTAFGKRQAGAITRTNQRQMQRALDDARTELGIRGEPMTPRSIARAAAANLKRQFKARRQRIAITQTQEAAESTKLTEVQAVSGKVPTPLRTTPGARPAAPERNVTKSWRDMDDSKVRRSHRIVDGTTLPEDGIFIVGPSQSRLRFPGDMALGAVVGETINCRCYADYDLIRS